MIFVDGSEDAIAFGGARIDGAAATFNNLQKRTMISAVGTQVHLPVQTTTFDNASETVAIGAGMYIGTPSWGNDNATLTMTAAATLYIQDAPGVGSNVAFTSPYAFFVDAGASRFDGDVGIGTGAAAPDGELHVMSASAGSIAANAAADELIVEGSGSTGIQLLTASGQQESILFGDAAANDQGGIAFQHGSNRFEIWSGTAASGNYLYYNSNAMLGLNDGTNTRMTTGILINQGSADNNILTFKSSDIATGHASVGGYATNMFETDDFFNIRKQSASVGGAQINFAGEPTHSVPAWLMVSGGDYETTTTTSANAAFVCMAVETDGSDNVRSTTANSNIFAIKCYDSGGNNHAKFIVKEDGDIYYDGADQGAFDHCDDTMLLRDLQMVQHHKHHEKDKEASHGVSSHLESCDIDPTDGIDACEDRLIANGILGEYDRSGFVCAEGKCQHQFTSEEDDPDCPECGCSHPSREQPMVSMGAQHRLSHGAHFQSLRRQICQAGCSHDMMNEIVAALEAADLIEAGAIETFQDRFASALAAEKLPPLPAQH
jgi:hypothetical protein